MEENKQTARQLLHKPSDNLVDCRLFTAADAVKIIFFFKNDFKLTLTSPRFLFYIFQ